MAFEGLKPLLAKFTKDSSDIGHEYSVLRALAENEPPVPGVVGPVELLTFGRGTFISSPGEMLQ